SAELLTNADLALYAAKGAGRNRAALFEPALRTRIDARVRLNQEFRAALDEGRIVPFYQPKVSFATGRVVGFEALTRWNHAVKGIL
ncbi:EAL domain-containing protein, partial [Serratia marcescens]